MKPEIHPTTHKITITCACGSEMETTSTREHFRVEICSNCHPFYTGQQRYVDTEGRIEKFQSKFGKNAAETMRTVKKASKKEAANPALTAEKPE